MTQKRVVTLFAVVVVLSAFLVVSTVNERSRAGFEEEVENYVEGVDPNADIEFSYTTGFFSSSPERVTVYGDGVTSDGVAERVSSVTDASVEVVVVQRETESAQTETAR